MLRSATHGLYGTAEEVVTTQRLGQEEELKQALLLKAVFHATVVYLAFYNVQINKGLTPNKNF